MSAPVRIPLLLAPRCLTVSKPIVNVQVWAILLPASTTGPTLTYDTNGTVSNTWNSRTGHPGSIVVVQVMYQWLIVLGPLNFNLSNLSNGKSTGFWA